MCPHSFLFVSGALLLTILRMPWPLLWQHTVKYRWDLQFIECCPNSHLSCLVIIVVMYWAVCQKRKKIPCMWDSLEAMFNRKNCLNYLSSWKKIFHFASTPSFHCFYGNALEQVLLFLIRQGAIEEIQQQANPPYFGPKLLVSQVGWYLMLSWAIPSPHWMVTCMKRRWLYLTKSKTEIKIYNVTCAVSHRWSASSSYY